MAKSKEFLNELTTIFNTLHREDDDCISDDITAFVHETFNVDIEILIERSHDWKIHQESSAGFHAKIDLAFAKLLYLMRGDKIFLDQPPWGSFPENCHNDGYNFFELMYKYQKETNSIEMTLEKIMKEYTKLKITPSTKKLIDQFVIRSKGKQKTKGNKAKILEKVAIEQFEDEGEKSSTESIEKSTDYKGIYPKLNIENPQKFDISTVQTTEHNPNSGQFIIPILNQSRLPGACSNYLKDGIVNSILISTCTRIDIEEIQKMAPSQA